MHGRINSRRCCPICHFQIDHCVLQPAYDSNNQQMTIYKAVFLEYVTVHTNRGTCPRILSDRLVSRTWDIPLWQLSQQEDYD